MIQFRLRTFLLVVAALSVALGWAGREVVSVRSREAIVETLRERGAYIGYKYGAKPYAPLAPDWLVRMLGDEFFAEVVSVQGLRFEDRQLELACRLPKLEVLDLSYSEISGDLSGLTRLAGLRELKLAVTPTNDESLRNLATLVALEELNLSKTAVTDAGLVQLQNLTSLKELRLYGTQCSDASVDTLSRMPNLQWLNLEYTQVSQAGLQRLQKALPECEIIWRSDTGG